MARTTAREAAFSALDTYFRIGVFIEESLEKFKKELSARDFSLAYEIATGVVRRKNALDAVAKKYAALPKKRQEKVLLRMCLYQFLFLDRIPDFAIGDEMVDLAKKTTSNSFAKFLNAFIRNQALKCTLKDLSAVDVLSYTDFYVKSLKEAYQDESAFEILELGNKKMPLFARDRQEMKMVAIEPEKLDEYVKNPRYYIQNPTQFKIYSHLKDALKISPVSILDLAASPGGKSILARDFFEKAELFCNDISDKKVAQLKENLEKYSVKATLTVGSGIEFPETQVFDLIIIDAPCSNSGCLYKCPEARWRITETEIAAHTELQKKLVQKAKALIAPKGIIWYSTCSVLPEENEKLCASMPEFEMLAHSQVLPNKEGFEGGFGAALRLKK